MKRSDFGTLKWNSWVSVIAGGGLFVVAASLGVSCATPRLSEVLIHRFHPDTLTFRRPSGPGADPKAGPGGTDYRSQPLPDDRLDCRSSDDHLKPFDLAAIRACLVQVTKPVDLIFDLDRSPEPRLKLRIEEETPICAQQLLKELPVPREVLFQSAEIVGSTRDTVEEVNCYSTRLNLEADEVLGSKMPLALLKVIVPLPMLQAPEDDVEMKGLLLSWLLTPLSSKEGRLELASRYVPESICKRCIGEKRFIRRGQLLPYDWPKKPKPSPSPGPSPTVIPSPSVVQKG